MLDKDMEVPEKELSIPSGVSTRPSSIHEKAELESYPISRVVSGKKTSEEAEVHSSPLEKYPKGFRLAAIIIALITSVFLVSLDNTIVATAIPRITGTCLATLGITELTGVQINSILWTTLDGTARVSS